MKILLTGGTGFIGRYLANKLAEEGHQLRLIVRRKPDMEFPPQVELYQGDITDFPGIRQAFQGMELVYHSAGKLGQAGVPEQVYEELHVTGTQNVIRAALEAGSVKRFIHVSSAGVQGPILSPPADERLPYAPSNTYERTKAAAEQAVLAAHRERGLPAVVIRPEFVYGPGDLHVLGLFRAIQRKFFVIFGQGRSLLHPTFIDDTIQALLLAKDAGLPGEVFIIAGPRPVTVAELADGIARQLGVRTPLRVPLWLGQSAAAGIETLGNILRIDPPLNRARLKFFTENRAFSTAKAQKLLGYRPMYDLEAGLAKTIAWYKQHQYL